MNLAEGEFKIALLCNFDTVFKGAVDVAEQDLHLFRGFIIKFVGFKAERPPIGHHGVGLYTDHRGLNVGIRSLDIMNVVGGNERDIAFLRELAECARDGGLVANAVILDLKVEVFSEKRLHPKRVLLRPLHVAEEDHLRNIARKAGRKRNQPLVVLFEQLHIDTRLGIKALGKGCGNHCNKISVSDFVLTKKNKVIARGIALALLLMARPCSNVDLTPDDGLYAGFAASGEEGYCTVHHTVVGKRHGRMPCIGRGPRNIADTTSTVKQAVFTMQMQMHKVSHDVPPPSIVLLQSFLFFPICDSYPISIRAVLIFSRVPQWKVFCAPHAVRRWI